jgi:hypothetical protein
LFDRLNTASPKHESPMEHPAQSDWGTEVPSNFHSGWQQARGFLAGGGDLDALGN